MPLWRLIHPSKYEEAISCFDEVLKLNANYEDAWANKGYALQKLGRHQEANECIRKGVGSGGSIHMHIDL